MRLVNGSKTMSLTILIFLVLEISQNATKATMKLQVIFLRYSFRGNSRYQNYRIELVKIKKTLITAFPINRDTKKTQPSKCTQMLLNLHQ